MRAVRVGGERYDPKGSYVCYINRDRIELAIAVEGFSSEYEI